ncbi:ABC transporter ATP-binding protein [Clostridia bacterium]|nr:ABC transporter ATP-binding protein [Clostridia bacterium]
MIEVNNLYKKFGKKQALDGLSFRAEKGKAFGLLGRNGAGKTTCMRIIMKIFPQDSGSVDIAGGTVGYLPEERGLYPKKTVIEQIVYIARLRGVGKERAKANAKTLLARLDAEQYLNSRLDTLSKGNQQKIQLALALVHNPEILILDEPFSGLDPVNSLILKDVIKEQTQIGRTVIFSSHQMPQIEEFCDDIALINDGKTVLSGNLSEIKRGYPRNRIYLECTPLGADLLQLDFPCEIQPNGRGYTVTLPQESDKPLLFSFLREKEVNVDSFYVIEPTLEEIFVENAGEDIG